MTAITCIDEHETIPLAPTGLDRPAAPGAEPGVSRPCRGRIRAGVGHRRRRCRSPGWVGEVHVAIYRRLQANSTALTQLGVNGLFVGRSALDRVEFARIIEVFGGAEVEIDAVGSSTGRTDPHSHQPLLDPMRNTK